MLKKLQRYWLTFLLALASLGLAIWTWQAYQALQAALRLLGG